MDNNGDIGNMLNGVLSNPDMMKKIMGVVSSLSGSESSNSSTSSDSDLNPERMAVSKKNAGNDAENRKRLIQALKPYLNENRRDKADKILSLLSILQLSEASGILNLLK